MVSKHILVATLIIVIAAAALTQPAQAGIRQQPDPLPGWTHAPKYPDDSPGQHGLVLSGKAITFGSPVIAEVDGITNNGKEVVIGGKDGRLYARRANGQALWEKEVPIAGCSSNTLIFGMPSVGALFGDGKPYVAIGYGSRDGADTACDGGVVVYRGSDGQQLWNFSQRNFDAQTPEGPEAMYGVITAVTMADTDSDGKLELAFGGLDRNLYLLNADGSLRWYYHAADSIWSTPLFMNVDGDPNLELVAGTDISANPNIIPPTQDGGFVYAFETAARSPARIVFQTGYIWRTFFDQVIYSSPLGADLLSSNPGLEIAVGSGCFWTSGGTPLGRWVKILNPANGTVLQTLNAPGCVQSSPAAADINDDGKLEIVATTRGLDNKGHVVAWNPANPTPLWDKTTGDPNSGSNDAFVDLHSPVIADLDGNGSLEVLVSNFWSVHVLAGKTGAFLTCQNTSCGAQISLFAWGTLKSTPAVGDINNDGKLDVVIGGENAPYNPDRAHVYAWTNFAGVLNSQAGSQSAYSAPWPMFGRTPQARALVQTPGLTASVRELRVLTAGEERTYRIALGSLDGSSISPSASVISDANGVANVRVVGTTLIVELDPGGLGTGNYTAVVRVTSPGVPALTVNLTLGVADDVQTAHLPGVNR